MTAADLLVLTRANDISLNVEGDRLIVDAPKGGLTDELRSELARQKPALLALLAPPRALVTLRHGPTLPVEAIELAIDLERRGLTLSLDPCQQVQLSLIHI